MPRFVILRHDPPTTGDRTLHWDLMLEDGDSLLTWALEQEPVCAVSIQACQLANHRLEYLNYEGPVSGGRGTVSRWDTGDFAWRVQNDGEFAITLRGGILHGQARLMRLAARDHRWVITFSAALSDDVR